MESDQFIQKIQHVCSDMIDHEDFLFISINRETQMSKCLGSQMGVDFINQVIMIDSKESNFIQLFENFVKDQYGIAEIQFSNELRTLSSTIKTCDLDPTNQKAQSTGEGSDSLSNEKSSLIQDEPVVKKSRGRPRKEVKATESTDLTESTKLCTPITNKGGSKKSESVATSRSGRKVKLPKWLQNDYSEIKEIKTEPEDVDTYGKIDEKGDNFVETGSKSFVTEGRIFKGKRDNLLFVENGKNSKGMLDECDKENEIENQTASTKTDNADESIEEKIKEKTRKRKMVDSELDESKKKIFKVDNSIKLSDENNDELVDEKEEDFIEQMSSKDDSENRGIDENDDEIGDEKNDRENYEKYIFKSCIHENDGNEPEMLNESRDENNEMDEIDDIKKENADENEESEEKKDSDDWSCSICDSKAKKCWLIRRHMTKMHDVQDRDIQSCRQCKNVFPKVEKGNHQCSMQSSLKCQFCNAEFKVKSQLRLHLESHDDGQEVPCNICGKKFRSVKHVKMHIYHTHKRRNGKALTTKMEPGVCDVCGKWFRFKCNAVRHREIHFDEKRFQCTVCNMKFRHSNSMKRHMISHQQKSENMYVCEQCGRSFKTRQTLLQHHRVHVQQPFLKCEFCNREFRTYKGKKYHILKDHSDKVDNFSFKSYNCEKCGKLCSSKAAYDEHLKRHDEKRSHVCTTCGSRWETVTQWKAHIRSHGTAPNRYRCKVCNILFKDPSKLRQHMMKDGHIKNCDAKGIVSDLSNPDIVEIIEYDFGKVEGTEEDLQMEMESIELAEVQNSEIQPMDAQDTQDFPEEIKVIHIEPHTYVGETTQVQIVNEDGVEIMYDEIDLPQSEVTVDGEQVIYQVQIDGENTIICDNLTTQAVESILKLQGQQISQE